MPVPLSSEELARWGAVLEAASRTQSAVDEAVLVGGTAVNVLVPYRTSQDADQSTTWHPFGTGCWNALTEWTAGIFIPYGRSTPFLETWTVCMFP